MAFKIENFYPNEAGNKGKALFQSNLHKYVTEEAWAAVAADTTYFNDLYQVVLVNDRIEVIGNITEDGSALDGGVVRVTKVDYKAKTVTTTIYNIYSTSSTVLYELENSPSSPVLSDLENSTS